MEWAVVLENPAGKVDVGRSIEPASGEKACRMPPESLDVRIRRSFSLHATGGYATIAFPLLVDKRASTAHWPSKGRTRNSEPPDTSTARCIARTPESYRATTPSREKISHSSPGDERAAVYVSPVPVCRRWNVLPSSVL